MCVEIRNLSILSDSRTKILDDINLNFNYGNVYGLIGKNSSGKTTLMNVICGLMFPTNGSCLVNGAASGLRLPSTLSDLVFVTDVNYFSSISAVSLEKSCSYAYPRFDKESYYRYLQIFEVDEKMLIDKLSMGQQKKVMISFALATNVNLLIFDEPTNGLDISSKTIFRKLLASSLNENQCVIISTHELKDMENIIDSLVLIDDSKILIDKSINDISKAIRFERGYVNPDEVLYKESTLHGKTSIVQNYAETSNRVELEVLFNALAGSNKEQIIELINNM
jgi:ABC-2 type transport system ATP-binding protein